MLIRRTHKSPLWITYMRIMLLRNKGLPFVLRVGAIHYEFALLIELIGNFTLNPKGNVIVF